MNTKTNEANTAPPTITLYNAIDRFQVISNELSNIETQIEDLKDSAHPGVFDIHIHYSMLATARKGAAVKFENGSVQKLTTKDIRMLTHLQHLVYELAGIVKDARAELLPN